MRSTSLSLALNTQYFRGFNQGDKTSTRYQQEVEALVSSGGREVRSKEGAPSQGTLEGTLEQAKGQVLAP